MSDSLSAATSKEVVASSKDELSRYVAFHVRQLYESRNGVPLEEEYVREREWGVVALADVSGCALANSHECLIATSC